MAGLYIHIPFCKQACHYCDFHFSTNLQQIDDLVKGLAKEIELQKHYLNHPELSTVYFGGGTPSLLESRHFEQLFNAIHTHFKVASSCEVTLEANPDDLSQEKLAMLKAAGINRLSIGIQSFDDDVLTFLNRAHNSAAALACVSHARQAGIENISIDLIYAIPDQSHPAWMHNIEKALALSPSHISAYALTIEPKTVFGNWLSKNKLQEVNEETNAVQFEMLMEHLTANGYEHYEISNFCKPNCYSQHNSSYWKQEPYLGIGPSAHSYNKVSRQFNIKNNSLYLKAIQENKIPFEKELLSRADQINEFLLTTLRTSWGCDASFLKREYNFNLLDEKKNYLTTLRLENLIQIKNQVILLTSKGKLVADRIASDLFVED